MIWTVELTIDELGQQCGLPVSTVRLYQARGLLPGPTKRGRVGFYGPGHVARLDIIGRLQSEGFSLAAIKHLVQAWEEGRGLEDVLGLETRLASWGGERLQLSPVELLAAFDGVEFTPSVMQRAVALGVIEPREDGSLTVTDAEFVRIGRDLIRLGLSPDEVLEEYEHLLGAARAVAARFVDVFDRHFLEATDARKLRPKRLKELTAVLETLQGLAGSVVAAAMRQALTEAASARLAELAARR